MNADWKVGKAGYVQCANINVARLQFDSCAEKDSLCGTVMSHDGLNLKSLDQCHGVPSHGTSSSQGWRKRIVVQQSKFDRWVYILVFAEGDLSRFAWESLPTEAGLCRHQCFSVVAQATAKIRPRPAQGLFSNFIEQLRLEWMLIERWGRQGMFNVPTSMWQDCSLTASAHTPKKQKNNNKRCADWNYKQSHALS